MPRPSLVEMCEMVEELTEDRKAFANLNEWEAEFVSDLKSQLESNKPVCFSNNQLDKLVEIHTKYC